MRSGALFMVLVALAQCKERPGRVAVHVLLAHRTSVLLSVENGTDRDIVMLSPAAPSRQVDEAHCTVKLSSKIDERVQPFAFAPELVTLRRGAKVQFNAPLYPLSLSKACARWTVDAEYAYVTPQDAAGYSENGSEEFRQHVLRVQQVATTTESITVQD